MCQANSELLALTDVLTSAEKAPAATCSAAQILFTIKQLKDKLYVIAVNLEDSEVTAEFNMAEKISAQASVMFENREIKISAGKLIEKFAPFERHVYELTIK